MIGCWSRNRCWPDGSYNREHQKAPNLEGVRHISPHKVSIIVPVYNTERYIAQCVKSLAAQSLVDIEVLVVHHDSLDQSFFELCAAAAGDSRIRIIDRQGISLADARNIGLSLAQGEYVGFVDADDHIEPDMYERLYAAAKRDGSDIAMCDYCMSYVDREVPSVLGLTDAAVQISELGIERFYLKYIAGSPTVWNKIYRRTLLERADVRFEIDDGEDLLFNMRLLPYLTGISTVGDSLYHYRIRKSSSMHDNIVRYSASSGDLLTAYLDQPVAEASLLPYYAFACTFTGFMFSSHCINRPLSFFVAQAAALKTVAFWDAFCIKITRTDELTPLYRENAISVRFYQVMRLICGCSTHGWERVEALVMWLASRLIRIKKRDIQICLYE